jgi:hypothetical protein
MRAPYVFAKQSSFIRRLATSTLLICFVATASFVHSASASASTKKASHHPSCMMVWWGGVSFTCYRPEKVASVERSMRFRPIDPVGTVRTLTALQLAQIIVVRGREIDPRSRAKALYYIFGKPTQNLIPDSSPLLPSWLVLSEGRSTSSTSPELSVYGGQPTIEPDGSVGIRPWEFGADLPHRHLFLNLASNLRFHTLQQIVTVMTQEDRR